MSSGGKGLAVVGSLLVGPRGGGRVGEGGLCVHPGLVCGQHVGGPAARTGGWIPAGGRGQVEREHGVDEGQGAGLSEVVRVAGFGGGAEVGEQVVMAGEGAAPSDASGVAAELGQGEAEAPSEPEMLVDAAAGAQRRSRIDDGVVDLAAEIVGEFREGGHGQSPGWRGSEKVRRGEGGKVGRWEDARRGGGGGLGLVDMVTPLGGRLVSVGSFRSCSARAGRRVGGARRDSVRRAGPRWRRPGARCAWPGVVVCAGSLATVLNTNTGSGKVKRKLGDRVPGSGFRDSGGTGEARMCEGGKVGT